MKLWLKLIFAALLCVLPIGVNAACRQALAIGLDVSSSVDPREYDLQMGGLADALMDAEVQAVLFSQPSAPVALAIFEWSSRLDQNLIVDWTLIKGPADLAGIAGVLNARHHDPKARATAIGRALEYGGRLLERAPNCWNLTLDISGDGRNNNGIQPKTAQTAQVFQTATINGLVIGEEDTLNDQYSGTEISALMSYYRDEVIFGPNAFVQRAVGFRGFQAAMRAKLLRELTIAMSQYRARYEGKSKL